MEENRKYDELFVTFQLVDVKTIKASTTIP